MRAENDRPENDKINYEGSSWLKLRKYVLRDGMIVPVLSQGRSYWIEDSTTYYPFTYHTSPVPSRLLTKILGENRESAKPVYLHTLFASLNQQDEVLRWINHFGLPVVCTQSDDNSVLVNKRWYSTSHFQPISLKEVLDEIKCLRLTIDIYESWRAKNSGKIKALFRQGLYNKPLMKRTPVPGMTNDNYYEIIWNAETMME